MRPVMCKKPLKFTQQVNQRASNHNVIWTGTAGYDPHMQKKKTLNLSPSCCSRVWFSHPQFGLLRSWVHNYNHRL